MLKVFGIKLNNRRLNPQLVKLRGSFSKNRTKAKLGKMRFVILFIFFVIRKS